MESRSEKFKRVATKRTNELLEKIRILGNCSNKSTYEYTEEEVTKIFKSLEKQLEITDEILTLIFPHIKEFLDFIHQFYFKSAKVGLTI